jgi:hypothetical protein
MRDRDEALYDHLSPRYGASLGLYANETHREFLEKCLERMAPGSPPLAAAAIYHYHPSPEQVRTWIGDVGMSIYDEGTGNGYAHFLARKR